MTTPSELKPGIRWWRVVGGGLLIELLLTIVAVPFFATGHVAMLATVLPPANLAIAIVVGAWAAKGTARPIPNGTLAGVTSIVVYVILLTGNVLLAPQEPDFTAVTSLPYLLSHVFKVLGGAIGGWLVTRRRA